MHFHLSEKLNNENIMQYESYYITKLQESRIKGLDKEIENLNKIAKFLYNNLPNIRTVPRHKKVGYIAI